MSPLAFVMCRQPFPLKSLWIITMVLNSTYSFYWDVEQDWDMPWIVQYGEAALLAVGRFCCVSCRHVPQVPATSGASIQHCAHPRAYCACPVYRLDGSMKSAIFLHGSISG